MNCLKMLKIGRQKNVVCGNFYNFSPVRRRKRIYMLFTAKGNVPMAEWAACAPTTLVVVRSCGNFSETLM
jgi:hypothetical protein